MNTNEMNELMTPQIEVSLPLNSNLIRLHKYYENKGSQDLMFIENNHLPFKVAYSISYDGEETRMCYNAYESYEDFIQKIKGQPKEHMRWNELHSGGKVPECYDLDAGIKDVPKESQSKKDKQIKRLQQKMFQIYKEKGADYVINKFLQHRKDFIQDHCKKYDNFEQKHGVKFAILTACDENKFSAHIVIRNGACFQDIEHLKDFMVKFHNYLIKDDVEFIFDKAIYSNHRAIRMLGMTKFKTDRFLVRHSMSDGLDDKDFLFWHVKQGDKLYKRKITKKDYVENSEKPVSNFLENNSIDDYKEMTQLLNLVNSDCDEKTWSTVAQYIYNTYNGSDEGLEKFVEWSKKNGYDEFNENNCISLWNSKSVNDSYGNGIYQLRSLAKEHNPEEYEELYPKKSFLKKDSCPVNDGAPTNHCDCALFMLDKIKESGDIYYYNKKKILFIYNDALKIFEEQPIEKIMKLMPTFLLPVIESVLDKCLKYTPLTKQEKKERKDIIKLFDNMRNNVQSTPYQRNILTQIIIRIDHGDDFIEKYFNRVPNLFPIANNMVIDFQTLEVIKRTKKHYFTYTTDNVYLPNRPKKNDVYKYVSEILKTENPEFISSFFTWNGYCLTGENCVKAIVFWTGDGDNGKSVAFNIFKTITGKSGVVGNAKVFTVSSRQSDSCHTDEYLPLIGKRSTYISEVKKGGKFNEPLMKHISGNDGELSLRGCGGTTMEVNIDCKMIGIVNSHDMPKFESEGFDNRIKIFPFTNKFAKNAEKVKEIESMKDDIFTEFCYYVKHNFYDNHKTINFSKEIEKATDKYKLSNDTIKMFFDDCIEITDNGKDRIQKKDLWSRYNEFCFDGEFQSIKVGKVEFYDYIEKKFNLNIHRNKEYKCVKYIVIENDTDDEDE